MPTELVAIFSLYQLDHIQLVAVLWPFASNNAIHVDKHAVALKYLPRARLEQLFSTHVAIELSS